MPPNSSTSTRPTRAPIPPPRKRAGVGWFQFDALNLPSSFRLADKLVDDSSAAAPPTAGAADLYRRQPSLELTSHSVGSEHSLDGGGTMNEDDDASSSSGDGRSEEVDVGVDNIIEQQGLRRRRKSSDTAKDEAAIDEEGDESAISVGQTTRILNTTNYDVRTKFGQSVTWSPPDHYEASDLEPYRQVGDPEMDAILDLCVEEGVPGLGRFDDIVMLSKQSAEEGMLLRKLECEDDVSGNATAAPSSSSSTSPSRKALANLYEHYAHPPDWVDWAQLQRGIDVFVLYGPAAGTSLYYRSLIGGFSIPKITAVLRATRYLAPPASPQKVMERLADTGGFLASCMASAPQEQEQQGGNEGDSVHNPLLPAASLRPGQQGWAAALRVRHLHARVRRSILHSKRHDWDVHELGVPINQEDMAATLLAFSVNVLVGIEFVAGCELGEQDQLDYLALWRYLGWLLGVDTVEGKAIMAAESSNPAISAYLPPIDPCGIRPGREANVASSNDPITHSYATLESIIFHLLNPDDNSKEVASHLLNIGRPSKKKNSARNDSNKSSPVDTAVTKAPTTRSDGDGGKCSSFPYRYRSFMCRRFLGAPLANELALPVPAKYTWESLLLFVLSTVHLVLMRLYTLSAMRIPWIRTKMLRWHANGMTRFHGVWSQMHGKRMGEAAARGMKGNTCSTENLHEMTTPTGGTDEPDPCTTGADANNSTSLTSACPFSLVMPPA